MKSLLKKTLLVLLSATLFLNPLDLMTLVVFASETWAEETVTDEEAETATPEANDFESDAYEAVGLENDHYSYEETEALEEGGYDYQAYVPEEALIAASSARVMAESQFLIHLHANNGSGDVCTIAAVRNASGALENPSMADDCAFGYLDDETAHMAPWIILARSLA
ncbi:MAG: hypothetical protein FWF59_08925 [Turicibacter sp.]|nr:hypothetical protein [Turicibacter sp.]